MTPFHARILASDTSFFDGSCEFMTVPCTDGAMGILGASQQYDCRCGAGELRFQPADEPLRTAAVSSGLVKIEDGEVLLLVDTAERPEDIDANRAKRRRCGKGGTPAKAQYSGIRPRAGKSGASYQPTAGQGALAWF